MVKKIIGAALCALALLTIIGAVSDGSIETSRGIGSATSAAINLLAGIFFIFFDRVYTLGFEKGFKKRKTQNILIITFTLAYAVLLALSCAVLSLLSARVPVLAFVLVAAPFLVPFIIFSAMVGLYVAPFISCKKHCKLNADTVKEYLSDDFAPINKKGRPLASKNALLFDRYFCIIPFDKISSVKFTKSVDSAIIFTLKNGKKIELSAGKKQFDGIEAAINDFRLRAEEEED